MAATYPLVRHRRCAPQGFHALARVPIDASEDSSFDLRIHDPGTFANVIV